MEILGYILAVFVGVCLGLIGSGGSILTIPILVYIMAVQPALATTYSLFIVGMVAMVGTIRGASGNLFNWKMGVYFGLPSIFAIFFTRKFLMPLLPDVLFSLGSLTVTKDIFIMVLFSILMLAASLSMIRTTKPGTMASKQSSFLKLIIVGVIVGVLTGVVGVGGGFLIIPSLLIFGHLSMKEAVPTSLGIVMVNALIGFVGSDNIAEVDWTLILGFTGMAIVGIFIGMSLNKKISNEKLKPAFGWFVLVVGMYILVKELFIK